MRRYLLGERWLTGLVTRSASGAPVTPDVAPTLKLWDSSGTKVLDKKLPKNRSNQQFYVDERLSMSAGRYIGTIEYTSGGTLEVRPLVLDIHGTSGSEGVVRAVHQYLSGGVARWIYETDAGNLKLGRSPK